MEENKEARGKPAVVLIAHERTFHLRKVLHSLSANPDFFQHAFVVVIDGANAEVESVVRSTRAPDVLLRLEFASQTPIASRINRATFSGLVASFDLLQASHTVVVEDDVVVSPTFLDFMRRVHHKFRNSRQFMAVNGFSNYCGESKPGYVRLNYGVGWGWSISRKKFDMIRRFWSDNPNLHWDSLVEGFLRTGFVVNPVYSKVINIGFDRSATHTVGENFVHLVNQMTRSFELGLSGENQFGFQEQRLDDFSWREDCLPICSLRPTHRAAFAILYRLKFWLEKIWRSESGRISDFSWFLLTKVRGFIDKMRIPAAH